MWSLFTTALKRGKSATQVSIMNTSTNFLVTAFTGLLIFSESLPPMWWAGASLLVAGSVIAGRKDEGDDTKDAEVGESNLTGSNLELDGEVVAGERYRDEDVPDLGELRS
jgi:drug/metabolite transporter (DMT)-like permease